METVGACIPFARTHLRTKIRSFLIFSLGLNQLAILFSKLMDLLTDEQLQILQLFIFFAFLARVVPPLLPYSDFHPSKKRQNKVKIWRRTHSLAQKIIQEFKGKTAQPCGFEGSWTNERYSTGTMLCTLERAWRWESGKRHESPMNSNSTKSVFCWMGI